MSTRSMARIALVAGLLFAVLSFAAHESGSAHIGFHPASHQPDDGSEIAKPLSIDGKQSARAFDQAHQTLRPDGTRQSPMAWP